MQKKIHHKSRPEPKILERFNVRRMGIIADSHIPDRDPHLNPIVEKAFAKVDLILHAGDISSPLVLEKLNKIAETIAVRGNNRGDKTGFHPPLPEKLIIKVNRDFRIGLFHGLENIYQRLTDVILGRTGWIKKCAWRLVKRVDKHFTNVDCIVYGHGHWPMVHVKDKIIFFNPGKAFGNKESSCGIIEIEKKIIRIKLVPLGKSGRLEPLMDKWHIVNRF
jgi:putative phosphoesterase